MFPTFECPSLGEPVEAAVRAFLEKPRGFQETAVAMGNTNDTEQGQTLGQMFLAVLFS